MTPTQASKKPAIVFDLGGVLLDWNPRHLFRKYFNGDEQQVEHFLTEICPQEWNLKQDAGYSFTQAIAEQKLRFPQYAQPIQAYQDRWEETVAGEIEGSVAILAELRDAGYPLYVLSNWAAETFARVRGKYAFLDWFDELIISAEVGLIKPDPAIFAYLLERVGLPAEECLFIDDHATNTEAAEKLGFQTVLFSTPEDLERDLQDREILNVK
jgi:2-haloacid dehalogenase